MEQARSRLTQGAGLPVEGRPVERRTLLTHHDTHPFTLDVLLLRLFGPQAYEWAWETVHVELQRRFGTTLSELNANKIEAMRTLHLSDRPWKDWETFEKVVQALNNNIPLFDRMQRCSLDQLWNGVHIMGLARRERFEGDVPRYVAAVFMDEAVWHCPEPLDFAAGLVRQDPDVARAFRSHDGNRLLQETAVDIQVSKLVVAREYAEMRDSQLKQQLGLVVGAAS